MNYATPEEIAHATYVAWLVTGFLGLVIGAFLWPAYASIDRATNMRVLAGLLVTLLALGTTIGMGWVHYKIAEEPFEPPMWIDPGFVSRLLPLLAVIVGFALTRRIRRRMAAR